MNFSSCKTTLTHSVMALCLCLPLSVAAEEGSIDIYATATMEALPASTLTPTPIQAPGLSRQDNAILHLGIIREQAERVESVGFFGGLFTADNPLNATLLGDLDIFLSVYADLPIAAEALYVQGQILRKTAAPEAALVSWLQSMAEYPNSSGSRKAQTDIDDVLKNDLNQYIEVIQGIVSNFPQGNSGLRLSYLINKLYPLNDQAFTIALTELQLSFLKRFPEDSHADEVQILLAHNQGTQSAQGGIFGFKKVLALYPHSLYRPEAMLAIADLQRLRSKEFEKAVENYRILIAEFPDHPLTKYAHQNLALTLNEDLRMYPEAIVALQTIVQHYPTDPAALAALQTIARLQAKKTNQPAEAVATLRKLATMFKGFEASDALEDAIKITERTLKDNALTLSVREQLVRDFPNSDAAPVALFDMAKQFETAANNPEKAKMLYQQLVQQYPEHKLAAEAKKRLNLN